MFQRYAQLYWLYDLRMSHSTMKELQTVGTPSKVEVGNLLFKGQIVNTLGLGDQEANLTIYVGISITT